MRFLNLYACVRQTRVLAITTLPVGARAGGGGATGGGGRLGGANVSVCHVKNGALSAIPKTAGSVPPGKGKLTGTQPYSGASSPGGGGGVPGAGGGPGGGPLRFSVTFA